MPYGIETNKLYLSRHWEKISQYFVEPGCDIGYDGGTDAEPFLGFEGWDLLTPGYNGFNIPRSDQHYSTVYSSHCLEHIPDPIPHLREWFRVLRLGGCLILSVPHQFLYEKKKTLPSLWNGDHKRFYTPASLLREIEEAYAPNTYRIVSLRDNAEDFDYSLGPRMHSHGGYEIELILRKITPPSWHIE